MSEASRIRNARKNRRERLFARSDLRGMDIAKMLGTSQQYIQNARMKWLLEENAAGREHFCECGKSIIHLGICRIVSDEDRAGIVRRLVAGDVIKDIARSFRASESNVRRIAFLMTDEQKTLRAAVSSRNSSIVRERSRQQQAILKERRMRKSDPAYLAEYRSLTSDFSVPVSEAAKRLRLTNQAVTSVRRRIVRDMVEAGQPVPVGYVPGPNAGMKLDRIDSRTRARIMRLLKGDLSSSDIAMRVGVSQDYVFRILRDLPEDVRARRDRRVRERAASRSSERGRAYGATMTSDLLQRVVAASVPASTEVDLADDVAQELVVRILSGEATMVDLGKARRAVMAEQRRLLGMSSFGPVSLDESIFDGGFTRMDMLADDLADDEDSILDRIDRERERENEWRRAA